VAAAATRIQERVIIGTVSSTWHVVLLMMITTMKVMPGFLAFAQNQKPSAAISIYSHNSSISS